MFSSDACCFRNGQLKQLNDGEGWGKQKHFIRAKTLEKIHTNQNEDEKKFQKIQLRTLLYTIFHEKGTPFHIPSISDKWCQEPIAPSTYLAWNFASVLTAVNQCTVFLFLFFFLHRNQSQK